MRTASVDLHRRGSSLLKPQESDRSQRQQSRRQRSDESPGEGEEASARRRRGGPVEQEEGSTARAVAAAVQMFSGELLDAGEALHRLQQQLDAQHEGYVACAALRCSVHVLSLRTQSALQQHRASAICSHAEAALPAGG